MKYISLGAGLGLAFVLSLPALIPQAPPAGWALFLGRFHPLAVHLPIGLLLLAVVLEVASRAARFGGLRPAVPFVLALGAASAVSAAAVGHLLALGGGYDEALLQWHRRLGTAVAVMALLALVAYDLAHRYEAPALRRVYVALLVGLFGVVGAAGHFGGSLTHGTGYLTQHLPEYLQKALTMAPAGVPEATRIENVDDAVVYEALIRPVLEQRCAECHNEGKRKGDLRLDSPEGILRGGEDGPVIVQGDALGSELVRRIMLPPENEDHMPPEGKPPLTVAEAEIIRWWIDRGAVFDQTVAQAERTPAVEIVLDGMTDVSDAPRGILAERIPPAAPRDLDALRQLGAIVVPVAQDVSYLHVRFAGIPEGFRVEALDALVPLARHVTWLDLGHMSVSDSTIMVLSRLENLTRLHLEETRVTDAGLAHLAGLTHLEYLNLYSTNVTDAGLAHIAEMSALRTLGLWQTEVNGAAVERLRAQRPNLTVLHAGELVVTPATSAEATGANAY